jgi:hypothetical protein
MYRQRSGQSEKRSDEGKNKEGDRKLDRQKDIVMETQSDGQTERQRSRQSEKWSYEEGEKQGDREIY